MAYEKEFLVSLALTLLTEIPIAILVLKYLYRHNDLVITRIVFAGFLVSSLTLPYLWFILPIYISDRNAYVIVGEVLVIIIEVVIYRNVLKIRCSEAILTSFLANLVSVTLGRLL